MITKIDLDLAKKFEDKEYFDEYFKIRVTDIIEMEVYDLKLKQGITEDLGEKNAISYRLETLIVMAQKLDACVEVRFVPREQIIQESKALRVELAHDWIKDGHD